MTCKILISDKIFEEGVKLLEQQGYQVTKAWNRPKTELPNLIGDHDALIVRSATKVTADLIAKGKKLRVIGRAGDGLDNVDLQQAHQQGIAVVNTPHVSATSVAELAIGHMLALARHIVEGTETLRQGEWAKEELMGTEVCGKTLGVIGCGAIGKKVEKLASALGMRVLGVDVCIGRGSTVLDKMLPEADFISLHVPLNPSTRHMLSTREFGIMKTGVMLIDCSRGSVIDPEALYTALVSGKVKAAALDVFEQEPPQNSKLLGLKNVYATPHIGAQTHEAQLRASVEIAKRVIEELEKPSS
ncbi:MAG: hydroxyacid dehydrogenase [Candidatus Bathyarchaeia archaeon]